MKKKNPFIFFLTVVGILSISGCNQNQKLPVSATMEIQTASVANDSGSKQPDSGSTKIVNTASPIKVFKNDPPLSGYGYDIYLHGKLYIHQPNIPAIQGNQGFNSENAATKTAGLVLYKIKNHIIPPGIDRKELDSLGVLK